MIRFVVGIVIGIIIVIFGVQNTETVDYQFLGWVLSAPRSIVVIGVFVLGLVSGWFVSGFRSLRRRKR